MKVSQRLVKITQQLAFQFKNRTFSFIVSNLVIIAAQLSYISLRYKYLNPELPFWYTRTWGDTWLAPRSDIYLIPMISGVLFLLGLGLILINKFYIKYYYELVWTAATFCNLFLGYSVFRIIQSASVPFPFLINPLFLPLLTPFVIAFVITHFALPYFIDFAHSHKLITNPLFHDHPAMILKSPSARGGGLVYSLVFLAVAIVFVGFHKAFMGLYLSVIMIAALGFIDDYQNTHPTSGFRVFENPFLRLFMVFLAILPTMFSGILIQYVSNPFDGVLILSNFGAWVPLVFTAIWVVWVMTVMSWSNGVDGQYCGIVGISSLIIAFLALRFKPLEPMQLQVAILAAISAGSAFGFTKYSWHPSKIMWGFGAMSAGLVLSALSISVRSKILASMLIIVIPLLDALVTVVRRLLQGKNPLSGDRGHLHHLLLDRGWSVKKIATFYWLTTFLFGLVGLWLPDKYSVQAVMIIVGLVAFMIILLNVRSAVDKHHQLESAKATPREAVR